MNSGVKRTGKNLVKRKTCSEQGKREGVSRGGTGTRWKEREKRANKRGGKGGGNV